MNTHAKVVAAIVVAGTLAMVAYKFALPVFTDKHQLDTSDARGTKGTLVIGTDNWIGYFPLCSNEMKKRMRRSGYVLRCEDDGADYASRMARLGNGELQFAVATIDSYLLNGPRARFPGTVIAVIDESKGGDALVAWQDKAATLDDLKGDRALKVAFTPDSPSEHLLKTVGVHFDVPAFRVRDGDWRVTSDGSAKALERLLAREVDAAVVWEPDVSRALNESGVVRLLGTEDTSRLIVDILVVNRKFSESQPQAVFALLSSYFRTLKHYRDNPQSLRDDVAAHTELATSQVDALLKGVAWATLSDNAADWFGVTGIKGGTDEGLVDGMELAVQILIEYGDFSTSPIPNHDPYRLTNSRFVAELYREGIEAGQLGEPTSGSDSLARPFAPLDAGAWGRLREIGTLKIRPIVFRSGTNELTGGGQAELDRAMQTLEHYPNFRLVIEGHTGLRGDPNANKSLSQARADAVARYLRETYAVDVNRLRPIGHGAERPLARRAGESERAYNYRLPRVELALVTEVY